MVIKYQVKYEDRYWDVVGSEYMYSASVDGIVNVYERAVKHANAMGWRVHSVHEVEE